MCARDLVPGFLNSPSCVRPRKEKTLRANKLVRRGAHEAWCSRGGFCDVGMVDWRRGGLGIEEKSLWEVTWKGVGYERGRYTLLLRRKGRGEDV